MMAKSQAITGLLLAISTITPLILVPFTADYFYLPKIVFVYVCLVGMFVAQFHDGKRPRLQLDAVEKLLGLYLIFVLVSTVFSVDPLLSLRGYPRREEGLFAIMAYALVFVMAKRHYGYSSKHLSLLLVSSLIVAGYGIAQYFGFDPIPRDAIRQGWAKRAFSTMGNPNFLGSYLTLMLPIASFAYLSSRKSGYLLATGIIYLALLCTMTRSSWIGALVSMGLLLLWAVQARFEKKGILVLLLVLILITLGMNQLSQGQIMGRFATIGRDFSDVLDPEADPASAGAGRIRIWRRVMELIGERPLLGHGLETLSVVYSEVEPSVIPVLGTTVVDKAHNEYLHMAVTTGIPSLLVYLGFLAMIITRAGKQMDPSGIIPPLLFSITGYLVQAFFNISVVSVAYLYWILLGILAQAGRQRR